MQAVTQSYSSQQYSHIQLGTAFPGDRTASSKQNWSHSQASQDDSISLSPEGRQLSRTPDAEPASDEMAREPKTEAKEGNDQQVLSQEELKTLHKSYKRLINPHVYKVSLSPKLKSMKNSLIRKFKFSDDEE